MVENRKKKTARVTQKFENGEWATELAKDYGAGTE
jgi:hypothetical protein